MFRECKTHEKEIIAMRRDLHRIPEIGFNLPETCAYVINKLNEFGIEYEFIEEYSGIVAYINKGKGRVLAFRADMDALNVSEETGLEYASVHEGKMHACGHDAHTAMLLEAAKVLNEHKDDFAGEIRFIFQPYEEGTCGAAKMVELGVLNGVDMIFGTHIGSLMGMNYPAGKVIAFPGAMMATSDRFTVKVFGKGCHGSTPELGIDPISVAAHIVLAYQEIPAREISATESAVVSVCTINAGNQSNAYPESAILTGTVRTFDVELSNRIEKRMREIAEATACAYRASVEFEYRHGPAPVINDPDATALAIKSAREVLGDDEIITEAKPTMVAEDFSVYQQIVPGAFLQLSAVNHEKKADFPHHGSHFDIDEAVLWKGSAVFVKIAENFFIS